MTDGMEESFIRLLLHSPLSLFIEPWTEVFCSKVPQSLSEGEVEVGAIQHFQIHPLLTSSLSSLNIGPLLFNPYILHNFNKLPLVQPGDCSTFTFPTVTWFIFFYFSPTAYRTRLFSLILSYLNNNRKDFFQLIAKFLWESLRILISLTTTFIIDQSS